VRTLFALIYIRGICIFHLCCAMQINYCYSILEALGTRIPPVPPTRITTVDRARPSSFLDPYVFSRRSGCPFADCAPECLRCVSLVVSVKLKFHWDQFPCNFLADLLATSPDHLDMSRSESRQLPPNFLITSWRHVRHARLPRN